MSCVCYKWGIVVMDVMSGAGEYLFRDAKVWWRCAQYFVIASCD